MRIKRVASTKRKMQNVSFSSVKEFLDHLPPDELHIVDILREMVFDHIPDIREKLSYNVPFYHRHASICFIWPSSVSWGGHRQSGVRMGFANGYLMEDEMGYLDKGTRKQVYWRDFFTARDIDKNLLSSYILQAVVIDDEKAKAKIRK